MLFLEVPSAIDLSSISIRWCPAVSFGDVGSVVFDDASAVEAAHPISPEIPAILLRNAKTNKKTNSIASFCMPKRPLNQIEITVSCNPKFTPANFADSVVF